MSREKDDEKKTNHATALHEVTQQIFHVECFDEHGRRQNTTCGRSLPHTEGVRTDRGRRGSAMIQAKSNIPAQTDPGYHTKELHNRQAAKQEKKKQGKYSWFWLVLSVLLIDFAGRRSQWPFEPCSGQTAPPWSAHTHPWYHHRWSQSGLWHHSFVWWSTARRTKKAGKSKQIHFPLPGTSGGHH